MYDRQRHPRATLTTAAALTAAMAVSLLAYLAPAEGQMVVRVGAAAKPKPVKSSTELPADLLVKLDPWCLEALDEADRLIREESYGPAVELLQTLLERRSAGSLVPVKGQQRRFVSIRDRVNGVIASMPAEGLKLYRRQYDPAARALLSEAIKNQDIEKLQRVVGIYANTRVGLQAVRTLAAMQFDRGRFIQAAVGFERALSMAPPAEDRPLLLAQQSVALHLAGERERARASLATLQKKHAKAEALLGGRNRPLVAFVKEVHELPVATVERIGNYQDRWPGLGGIPDGLATMAHADVVLVQRWGHPGGWSADGKISKGLVIAEEDYNGMRRMRAKATIRWDQGRLGVAYERRGRDYGKGTLPSYIHPVVAGGLLVYRGADGFYGLDPETGQLVCKSDVPLIRPYRGNLRRPYYYGYAMGFRDNGRYTLTVGGGRIYGVGWFAPEFDRRYIGRPGMGKAPEDRSEIIALEVESELKLPDRWQPTSGDGAPEALRGMKYLSAPSYKDGRLYVVAVNGSPFHMVCLDADTGGLIWETKVSDPPSVGRSRIPTAAVFHAGSPPAVDQGQVFAITNAGVAVALEADTGRVLWAHQYTQEINPQARSRRVGRGRKIQPSYPVNPVILTQRHMICLPTDSEHLLVLDRIDGTLVKKISRQGQDYLSAIDAGRLALSGPGLTVLEVPVGKTVRKAKFSDAFGRPAVSNESISICGPEKIYTMDLASGQVSTRLMSSQGGGVGLLGNLISVGGQLIAANGAGVSGYMSYEGARDLMADQIRRASGGKKLNLLYDRGQFSYNAGRIDHALDDYLAVKEAIAGGQKPAGLNLTELDTSLHKVYLARANGLMDDLPAMQEALKAAEAVAASPRDKAHMKLRLAKFHRLRCRKLLNRSEKLFVDGKTDQAEAVQKELAAETAKALAYVHEISADYGDLSLADVKLGPAAPSGGRIPPDAETIPAKRLVEDFVGDLLRQYGREAYVAIDEKARMTYEQALASEDVDALVAVADTWPNSLWADDARFAAADICYRRARAEDQAVGGLLDRAIRQLSLVASDSDERKMRIAATVGLAMIYDLGGRRMIVNDLASRARAMATNSEGQFLDRQSGFAGNEGMLSDLLGEMLKDNDITESQRFVGRIQPPLQPALQFTADGSGFPYGYGFWLLRDQDFRPVRLGQRLLGLWGDRAVLVDTDAPDPQSAITWKALSGFSTVLLTAGKANSPAGAAVGGTSSDGKVIVVAGRTEARGFAVDTAKALWRVAYGDLKLSAVRWVGIGSNVVVLVDMKGMVQALRCNDGKALWAASVPGWNRASYGPPTIDSGLVLLRYSYKGKKSLVCYSAETGKKVQQWNGKQYMYATFSDSGLLVTMVDGKVSVYDPAKPAEPVWQKDFGAKDRPSLVAVGLRRLAVSESDDSPAVKVLSLATGAEEASLDTGHRRGRPGATPLEGQFAGDQLFLQFSMGRDQTPRAAHGRQSLSHQPKLQCWQLPLAGKARKLWSFDVPPEGARFFLLRDLAVGREHVVLAPLPDAVKENAYAYLLNRKTGDVATKIDMLADRQSAEYDVNLRKKLMGPPVMTDGRLVVETLGGMTVYDGK